MGAGTLDDMLLLILLVVLILVALGGGVGYADYRAPGLTLGLILLLVLVALLATGAISV